jgi:hypothetical protein
MRTWDRVRYHERCGGCGLLLEISEPVLRIVLRGLDRPLLRCQDCAGLAPLDLPPLPERAPVEPHVTRIAPRHAAREWMPYPDSD